MLVKAAVALAVFSLCCFAAEATFYSDIDENGFLQESFFLPLAFILAAVSFLLFVIALFLRLVKK